MDTFFASHERFLEGIGRRRRSVGKGGKEDA
jgi:hypothetical protein